MMRVFQRYCTINPSYPEAHTRLYESRRVCDCTWGSKWTRKCIVRVEWPKKRPKSRQKKI